MKGKLRILGHVGLALFVAVAVMLAAMPAAKVEAATAVTDVWVDFAFTDTVPNKTSQTAGNVYYIHFKPATALNWGEDTVTVFWPDGTAAMSGVAGSGYAFTVTSAKAAYVFFSTNYGTLGANATWKRITSDSTVGGYRTKFTTPIDVAAGQDVWVKFVPDATNAIITAASTAGILYKVKVATSQDTTPVLSSAFALGDDEVLLLVVTPLVTTAGVGTQYIAKFTPSTQVPIGGKVTIKFPLGTTMPSSISTTYVLFSTDNADYSNATAATVDADLRTVTGTTPIALATGGFRYMKIASGAGLANPQTATEAAKAMISTSVDAWWQQEADARTHGAGSATKIIVANGEIGEPTSVYSDDATMINMLSSYIYVTTADQYGNAKLVTGGITVTPSSSSGSGTFYKSSTDTPSGGVYSSITSITVDAADPADDGQQVFYKDTTAGTHTLTFSHASYTDATWTITVAPAISLYDASDNLINTYAASSTSPVSELEDDGTSFATPKYGVDYINDAITAAFAGDTIKLGDGIYELDEAIALDKKITFTSVNGAASTTLRPTTTVDYAILVTADGTAAAPVIIDGLTFTRLRSTTDFDCAIRNNGYDYMTVRNNIFTYIVPDAQVTDEGVVWVRSQAAGAIASCTISDNTFSNCTTTWPDISNYRAGNIVIRGASGAGAITGLTISGNTLTDCYGYGIQLIGESTHLVSGSVTNNTFTDCYLGINTSDWMGTVTIIGNTITGAYSYGIKTEGTDNTSITIKKNTITGCSGNEAIRVGDDAGTVICQYNDIYDNASGCYAIRATRYQSDSTYYGQDCKYNWFGSATGPAYTALTGATITKSNPNGTGGAIYDAVIYYPWLHKPVADVVADNASYQACTMSLVTGWNTLSTPVKLITAANAIDELISADDMEIGYYYDAGWQLITTGYVLNACDAVYVKMDAAAYVLLKFDASAFSTPSKDLAAGWNMISLAYLSSSGKLADDAVASVALTAAGLPGYSQLISPSLNATQTNMFGVAGTSWAYASGQTESAGGTCYAGLGYWIYMQNAATLAGFEITPIAPDLD